MPIRSRELLIATHNQGKLDELKDLFAGLSLELQSLSNFENILEVEETGTTFAENARLKAGSYARQTGLIALADDSGLEIEALDGRPGVLSARYGGPQSGFGEKMDGLLKELDGTGDESRRARFVSAIAVADATGNVQFTVEGICNGTIAEKPLGTRGFGYDPLFIPDGFDQTFGELPDEVKQKISHRARAFNEIIPYLLDFIAV